jgi:light-regulated signal transduction histidine kinase (bacteriophytochrome)
VGIEVSDGLDAVTLDQHKFKQVLYNLLSNAVKFTDEGGQVDIHARRLDPLLILGPRHLDRILRIYVQHYNRRRPHRGLKLRVPESIAPIEEAHGVPDIERLDLLGGLVHEYVRAA